MPDCSLHKDCVLAPKFVIANFKSLYLKGLLTELFNETEISGKTSLHEFWREKFDIVVAIEVIKNAWEGVSEQTLRSSWKKLLQKETNESNHPVGQQPNLQIDEEEDNFQEGLLSEATGSPAVGQHLNSETTREIMALGEYLNLEMDEDDINEMQLDSRDIENLGFKDLQDLINLEQEEEGPSSDDARSVLLETYAALKNKVNLWLPNDNDFATITKEMEQKVLPYVQKGAKVPLRQTKREFSKSS
ncbi:uncharacterized protein LOC129794510 [Lutzomyia longipalpis]|uniref:uncharacterized protein LOC129794510 n=1 Tax=Lutzomyia longipalpis TaxID=7200 RepID=UPI0024839C0C|nr:uncharacterized protein LOC129794510 [Lutzomyia longipalpis]